MSTSDEEHKSLLSKSNHSYHQELQSMKDEIESLKDQMQHVLSKSEISKMIEEMMSEKMEDQYDTSGGPDKRHDRRALVAKRKILVSPEKQTSDSALMKRRSPFIKALSLTSLVAQRKISPILACDTDDNDYEDDNCSSIVQHIDGDKDTDQDQTEKQHSTEYNDIEKQTSESVLMTRRPQFIKALSLTSMFGFQANIRKRTVSYEYEPIHATNSSTSIQNESKSTSTSSLSRIGLNNDTYSMMTLSEPFEGYCWWFGTGIFVLQSLLLGFILYGQIVDETSGEIHQPVFNTPINASTVATISQLPAILVAILMTKDIIEATKCIELLLLSGAANVNRQSVLMTSFSGADIDIGSQDINTTMYGRMVLWPNVFKCLQGFFSLVTSFIIIVSSSNVTDLFKDFMALQIVSIIDDIAYYLCTQGFFGTQLQKRADAVDEVTLVDSEHTSSHKIFQYIPLHAMVVLVSFIAMGIGWAFILHGQVSGSFFRMKYPQCQVELQGLEITRIGDGKCDGGLYNRFECGFDGGDCLEYQLAYPGCDKSNSTVFPWKIADGECDQANNNEQCGWDGGDCCQYDLVTEEVFHNDVCNATKEYNNVQCKFDNGECLLHNLFYPGCVLEDVEKLGNEICDGGNYIRPACRHDGGDCLWSILGADINGESAVDMSGWSVSLSSDGNRLAIGAFGNDGSGSNAGHVRVFELIDGSWSQLGLDIEGESAGDWSGSSVSLSSDGNRVAIGAPINANAGHVRVFELVAGSWTQLGIDIDGESSGDLSGRSVSLSSDGNRLAIGAVFNNGGGDRAGQVRVFELVNGLWVQVGLDIDGEGPDDRSGYSVSLSSDGSRVAIGAPYNDGESLSGGLAIEAGHVRIFELVNGSWVQLGLDIDGESAYDRSGWSVALSADGNRVAIGAYGNSNGGGMWAGHVRVFELVSGSWIQVGLDIDGESPGDESGWSVSLSSDGNRVAIGAIGNDGGGTDAGQVRVFELVDGSWVQLGLDIDGEYANDKSGVSVSLSSDGKTVAIGASFNADGGDRAGQVRVYAVK